MRRSPPPSDSEPRRFGRLPSRQAALLSELRQLITRGDYPPGSRLPTRAELQDRFAASCITVQRVVDRLAADGLVEARGPLGTFVVDQPPHLHRIALVFPYAPSGDGQWLSYYAAIARAAANLQREGLALDIIHDSDRGANHDDFDRLQRDCRDGLLAGLIFTSPPEVWEGTPLSDAALPRISLSHCQHSHALIAVPDQESFATRAIAHLIGLGCRNPAVICSTSISELPNTWASHFTAAGLPLRPQWLLGADLGHATNASRIARLLFAPWCNERPDALIIADDNFEAPVLAGLMTEGIRIGSDVQVIAHANFPLATASAAPVIRLGFEVTSLLRYAVESIHAQRDGQQVEPLALAATFADGT
jgi:DNA-binding LacI/PurR family transcriptional regulator